MKRLKTIKHEDYKGTNMDRMNINCNQCDYQAKHKSSLRHHKRSKHDGVKYTCNKCDYQASWKKSLTQHILSKHEGLM